MIRCDIFDRVSKCFVEESEESAKKKRQQARIAANKAKHARKKKSRQALISNILGRETGDVKDFYTLGKELKKIPMGAMLRGTDKRSGEEIVCKKFAKRKMLLKTDVENVRREVAILYHLSGFSEFVQIRAAYEDSAYVYVILEACTGGELFDGIVAKGKYSERQAAAICRSILTVVHKCHSMGVMHRNLTPENFVFKSGKEGLEPKLTEFDSAVFVKPGEIFHDNVCSAYYVAPEVVRKNYSYEADVWSMGVILYELLSGRPPFWATNEEAVKKSIVEGRVDLQAEPWPSISELAKDLVRKMLTQNPQNRISTADSLNHPWVKVGGTAPDKPLDPIVVTNLKQFSATTKMKKLALRIATSCLSDEELEGLCSMFKTMDVDAKGTISCTELQSALAMFGTNMDEEQSRALLEASEFDGESIVNYMEFTDAARFLKRSQGDEGLFLAFQLFDADNSGAITMDELREALLEDGEMPPGEVELIIAQVDSDKDGSINYEEFALVMRKEETGPIKEKLFPLTFK